MENEWKFCSNCGEKQPKEQEECSKCGYVFASKEGAKPAENNRMAKPKKKRRGLGIGLLLGLLVLIVAGVYFFRDSFTETAEIEESIAGTYTVDETNAGDFENGLIIDEDYYTQVISTNTFDDGKETLIWHLYMKHEKDNLYVVDFAEGFILEATLEPFSEDIDALEEELYAAFSDEEMSELGFTIGNDGKKISVKSKVLSNADIWEHELFYAEDFNFEKIGENLRMTEEDTLLIKQPTAEADN